MVPGPAVARALRFPVAVSKACQPRTSGSLVPLDPTSIGDELAIHGYLGSRNEVRSFPCRFPVSFRCGTRAIVQNLRSVAPLRRDIDQTRDVIHKVLNMA
jgi:hypothetical protein